MFIKFTYVDAVTGIPVTVQPAGAGPVMPKIPDLLYTFALESLYPTETPTFYGTCRDGIPATTTGILAVLTEAEYTTARNNEFATRLRAAREKKYAELKNRRKQSELTGVAFTSLGEETFPAAVYIPAEKDDQDRINSALSGMERWPQINSISFKANNNVFIAINYDQLNKIGYAVAKLSQAAFTNEGAHSMKIAMLQTVDEILSYDISTGWPN